MKKRSDPPDNWDSLRENISGLGERSLRKSYYPELQRHLAELEGFRAYIQLLLDSTDEGIYGIDLQASCTLINRSAAKMVGYRPEDLLGKNMHEIVHHTHPDGSPYPADECAIVRAVRVGQGVRIDSEVFWRRDGTSFPVEYSSHPILEGGVVTGAVVTFVDITERKRMEESLRRARDELETRVQERTAQLAQSNQQLQTEVIERKRAQEERERLLSQMDITFTSIADGLVIYDAEGKIVRMNPTAESILGYTQDERHLALAERIALLRLEHGDGQPFTEGQMPAERALRGETVRGLVMVIHQPRDGRTVWTSASAAPIRTHDGTLLGAVSVFTDVTALHELQEWLQDLIHTVSHDLRNPLMVIQGQAQLLLRLLDRAGLKGPEWRSAEAIATGSKRMNAMIQDLVESARLESGQLRLEKRAVDLRAFVADLLDQTRGVMDVARIKVEMPEGLPRVSADPDRLERIFVNLLSNALKYSPSDTEVLIRASRTDAQVTVSITDSGIGIAPEELPHIFERFYRVKGARKAEGLGLGLYITRMLVEAHGGFIRVESKPEKGSSFYFALLEARP